MFVAGQVVGAVDLIVIAGAYGPQIADLAAEQATIARLGVQVAGLTQRAMAALADGDMVLFSTLMTDALTR